MPMAHGTARPTSAFRYDSPPRCALLLPSPWQRRSSMAWVRSGKDQAMNGRIMKYAVAFGLAGAIAIGTVSPTWAAPVSGSTTAVKWAEHAGNTTVRYLRDGRGPGGVFDSHAEA